MLRAHAQQPDTCWPCSDLESWAGRQALSAVGDQGSAPRSSAQAWPQASQPFQHALGKAAQLAGTK